MSLLRILLAPSSSFVWCLFYVKTTTREGGQQEGTLAAPFLLGVKSLILKKGTQKEGTKEVCCPPFRFFSFLFVSFRFFSFLFVSFRFFSFLFVSFRFFSFLFVSFRFFSFLFVSFHEGFFKGIPPSHRTLKKYLC